MIFQWMENGKSGPAGENVRTHAAVAIVPEHESVSLLNMVDYNAKVMAMKLKNVHQRIAQVSKDEKWYLLNLSYLIYLFKIT